LAVGAVIAYHLRPDLVPGGFVGVDVFFVLSGFFITSSLLPEQSNQRIQLRAFWARRIRRLMPAAVVLILFVVLATMILAPVTSWSETLWQAVASGTSWENWYLAAQSVDYLRAAVPPSPLQHFWSLSVEEQFYLAWPFVLAGLALVARARRLRTWRTASIVLFVVFLGWSIIETAASPSTAYFSTATRAWELLLGCIVALFARELMLKAWTASVLFVSGMLGVIASIIFLSGTLPFPSAVALLPTLGATAIVISGFGERPAWMTFPLRWRPVGYLGDISYSLYLWHWPIIVLMTPWVAVGPRLPGWAVLVALAASVTTAAASYELIERRFLGRGRILARRPVSTPTIRSGYRLGAILLATLLVGTGLGLANQTRVFAQQRVDANPRNFPGARVFDPRFDRSSWNTAAVTPLPSAQSLQAIPRQLTPTCLTLLLKSNVLRCEWGDPKGAISVVVVGDSHAAQWIPAIDAIARIQHWKVTLIAHQYCTLTAAQKIYFLGSPGVNFRQCETWNRAVMKELLADPPDLVIQGSLAYGQPAWLAESRQQYGMERAEGYAKAWTSLLDAGVPVVAFDETPQPNNVDLPGCATRQFSDPSHCSTHPIPIDQWDERIALAHSIEPRAGLIDANAYVCPERTCHAELGNVLVFRDTTHLTSEYSRSLAWLVDADLRNHVPELFSSPAPPH